MKQPSDKVIRAAVMRWARAEVRWLEFALANPMDANYRRLCNEAADRRDEEFASAINLRRIGMKLLAQSEMPEAKNG